MKISKLTYSKFIFKLLLSIILCVIGLVNDNLIVFLSSMLISPILDAVIEISNNINNTYTLLIGLFIPLVAGLILSIFIQTPTKYLINAGAIFYSDKIKFLWSSIVAITCGFILHLSDSNPIIGVAINLACALLPQNIALGYYLGDIILKKNNFTLIDLIICLLITIINIFGLLLGDSLYKEFIKKYIKS
tara:strand:- start:2903 stop:3472 length:570 start_codon:yes stop_codon:yes gene_type:complete